MRMVQTLWSKGEILTETGCGWLSPKYHLMSWAMSALKLRENYDKLFLYSDRNGYDLLGDFLGLPYKKIFLRYDDIDFHRNLWAIPKLLTYSAQEEPFLHVDGDVYLWSKLPEPYEKSELIVQNQEIGTGYYKNLIGSLLNKAKILPSYLKTELKERSIPSYNLGILGGTNTMFIKEYCQEALNYISTNKLNEQVNVSINENVLFEQILFYAYSKYQKRKVDCLIKNKIIDNGYCYSEFCDFSSVGYRYNYMHIIGGNKRIKLTCELLERSLLKQYPTYFFKIISLFKKQHSFYTKRISPFVTENNLQLDQKDQIHLKLSYRRTLILLSIDEKEVDNLKFNKLQDLVHANQSIAVKEVFECERFIEKLLKKWDKLPHSLLFEMEKAATDYYSFLHLQKEVKLRTTLKKNPYLAVFDKAFNWSEKTKRFFCNSGDSKTYNTDEGIAIIPQLLYKGYREVYIDKLCYNTLAVIENGITFQDILSKLEICFSKREISEEYDTYYKLINSKLKYLFFHKCIYLEDSFLQDQ